MRRGQVVQKHIDVALDSALSSNGVDYNHGMRAELDAGAELTLDGKDVRVPDERGRMIPVRERVIQLKQDPRWASEFPPDTTSEPKRIIAKNNLEKLAENFDDIAAGCTKVVG
jgi:hypothetical protein